MPEKPPRHIVFNMSAAGSLRQALNLPAGLNDKHVLGCPDDLSYGPINPPDPVARIAWLDQQLGGDEDDSGSGNLHIDKHYWSGRIGQFWRDTLDPDIYPVIWVCRRCAQEFAGFLELIHRLGDAPCDVIDVTDLVIDIRRPGEAVIHQQIRSFGEVHPRHMIEQSLWDRRTALSDDDRAKWRAMWRACQSENAPLRIIEADILISAPITYFDDYLLSFARHEWMKAAWIVGEAGAMKTENGHIVRAAISFSGPGSVNLPWPDDSNIAATSTTSAPVRCASPSSGADKRSAIRPL